MKLVLFKPWLGLTEGPNRPELVVLEAVKKPICQCLQVCSLGMVWQKIQEPQTLD